jgi:hypothetical protein
VRIRHLKIANFRGIQSLNWTLGPRVVCLVGQNDATKTGILDAIELGLWPRSYYPITDTDFYKADVDHPICVEVTVGEIPAELLAEEKFGLYLRGFSDAGGLVDDPGEGLESVVTIRCEITAELEPNWSLIKNSQPEPRHVSWRDREKLGLARLGADVDRHLTWSRGSALVKLTAGENSLSLMLANVSRAARAAVTEADLPDLEAAADTAKTSAARMGAKFVELEPGLDATGLSLGNSVFALHEDKIPLRLWGLGTKRLAALAIQQSGTGADSILLIDEIEFGLEPHRIRHLLRRLSENLDGAARIHGQVILTTHSPTAALTLPISELAFVRSRNGETTALTVDPAGVNEVQSIARVAPHSLFGRKLVVCEGATEVGMCRGLEPYWSAAHGGLPPAHLGFVPIDGGGRSNASNRALALKRVGFDVVVLADSDEPLVPDHNVLNAAGVTTFLWAGGVSTEERLAADLPIASLQELIAAAVAEFGEELVVQQVVSFAEADPKPTGVIVTAWIQGGMTEALVRRALGRAAKHGKTDCGKGWFKYVSLGEQLGGIVGRASAALAETPTGILIGQLATWTYG